MLVCFTALSSRFEMKAYSETRRQLDEFEFQHLKTASADLREQFRTLKYHLAEAELLAAKSTNPDLVVTTYRKAYTDLIACLVERQGEYRQKPDMESLGESLWRYQDVTMRYVRIST